MAYQGYSDQPANQSGPSPYGQAGNPYDEDTSYNGNPYSQGQYDARPGNNYEMSSMNRNDPNRILNECRAVDAAVDQLDEKLQRLKGMQLDQAGSTTPKESLPALQAESQALLQAYRELVGRMKNLKQDKDSGNPRNAPQVGRVDRKVKTALTNFQKADSEYRQKLQETMERDYRIVRPDASDAEVKEATQDPNNTQVFSQALINSDRRGNAQNVASKVRSRHLAIQKIEQDMMELAQMFQDLDALVVQQEAQVTQIEQRGEEVREDVTKANVELDGAVVKARAARKKKWICLGIGVAVVVVIVVVVVVAVVVTRK